MEQKLKDEFMLLEHEALQAEQEQEKVTAEILQPSPETSNEPPTKDLLMPIISMACDVLVPNWGINSEEKQILSENYASVLDKYFPDSMSKLGVEFNAVLVTAMIFGPRLSVPRIIEVEPEKETQSGGDE